MLDPFLISGGIGAIGSLFKGLTGLQVQPAGARKDAYRKQGEEAEMQSGVQAQERLRRRASAAAAHAAVTAAANGGGPTGSSMGVIQNLSSQAMFNACTAICRGNQANQNDIYQGQELAKAQKVSDLVKRGDRGRIEPRRRG